MKTIKEVENQLYDKMHGICKNEYEFIYSAAYADALRWVLQRAEFEGL